jgi:hypothetical protein
MLNTSRPNLYSSLSVIVLRGIVSEVGDGVVEGAVYEVSANVTH